MAKQVIFNAPVEFECGIIMDDGAIEIVALDGELYINGRKIALTGPVNPNAIDCGELDNIP